jgi:hypothetical protein
MKKTEGLKSRGTTPLRTLDQELDQDIYSVHFGANLYFFEIYQKQSKV